MVKYENECCNCDVPCSNCGRKRVKHLYCDNCGADVEELYNYFFIELCEKCVLERFEKITLED